jgi:hypothetical protein
MPCVALARGIRQTPPHTSPLAFNDAINNSPCARKIVTTVNGVSVSAENLCPVHWITAHGYRDWVLPVVLEP